MVSKIKINKIRQIWYQIISINHCCPLLRSHCTIQLDGAPNCPQCAPKNERDLRPRYAATHSNATCQWGIWESYRSLLNSQDFYGTPRTPSRSFMEVEFLAWVWQEPVPLVLFLTQVLRVYVFNYAHAHTRHDICQ